MSFFTYRGPLPTDSDLFRGRQDTLAALKLLCKYPSPEYAIVYGGRQTGKTSLLHRLIKQIEGPKAVVCLIDCQRLSGASTLTVYRHIMKRVRHALSLSPVQLDEVHQFVDLLNNALRSHASDNFILLFEELGTLTLDTRKRLANDLRFMFNNRFLYPYPGFRHLMVVIAGSVELFDLATKHVSPLHNCCTPFYLPDLSAEDAQTLIINGLLASNLSARKATQLAKLVYAMVNGQPYLTQRIGALLENHIAAGLPLTRHVTNDLIEQLLWDDPLLKHLHDEIQDNDFAYALQTLRAESIRASRFEDEMAQLELLGLIREQNGRWWIRNALYAIALNRWFPLAQQSDVTVQRLSTQVEQDYARLVRYESALRVADREATLRKIVVLQLTVQQHQAKLQAHAQNEAFDKIANTLQQIQSNVDELLVGQDAIRADLVATHTAIVNHFDVEMRVLVTEVMQHVDARHFETVSYLLDAVEQNRFSASELNGILLALQSNFAFLKASNIVQNERLFELMSQLDGIAHAELNSSHKLKAAIPIIPCFLDYEFEIGLDSGFDLASVWECLTSRLRRS